MKRGKSAPTAFTSFTYSYLPKAMVLAETLKHFNPHWRFVAVVSDRLPDGASEPDLGKYFDEILTLDDLGVSPSWVFKHDIVELCTAVKGPALHWLLKKGARKVFYLDPDIAVLSELSGLERVLDHSDITLTPHQLAPDSTSRAIIDNEICSLKHGTYNLGFVGVRNSANGLAFARWWEDRLRHFCYDDIPNGLFTDQRWCDLVPSFFDGVAIHKDPGCNVSSWNLSTRTIESDKNGRILVNGSPLKFYHFSKLGELGFSMTTKYAGNNTDVHALWYWYNKYVRNMIALIAAQVKTELSHYWHFAKYDNGEPISKAARVAYRTRPDLQEHFVNPFDGSYCEWAKANKF